MYMSGLKVLAQLPCKVRFSRSGEAVQHNQDWLGRYNLRHVYLGITDFGSFRKSGRALVGRMASLPARQTVVVFLFSSQTLPVYHAGIWWAASALVMIPHTANWRSDRLVLLSGKKTLSMQNSRATPLEAPPIRASFALLSCAATIASSSVWANGTATIASCLRAAPGPTGLRAARRTMAAPTATAVPARRPRAMQQSAPGRPDSLRRLCGFVHHARSYSTKTGKSCLQEVYYAHSPIGE